MRRLLLLLIAAVAGVASLGACGAPRPAAFEDRAAIAEALTREGVVSEDRSLVHLSHTCDLLVDGAVLHVLDVRELVPGSMAPRGLNRIVVVDSSLVPVQKIEYVSSRPLFCRANRLYLYGDIAIDNVLPEGNVLTFTQGSLDFAVSAHVDASELPALVAPSGD